MTYLPFQQRVVEEKAELDEKLKKLISFQKAPTFSSLDAQERGLLFQQTVAMEMYSRTLEQRIAAFK